MPAMEILRVRTAQPEQKEIAVHVVRGGSPLVAEGHSLGWYRVEPPPAAAAGTAAVILIFRVAGGAVTLGALDASSRRPLPLEPVAAPAGR